MSVPLLDGEHIELIDDRLRLIVSSAHTFGTDALLLAAFGIPHKNQRVCDFGTGCGIIPFFWLSRGVNAVTAVEIQGKACDQVKRSVRLNEAEDRFTLIEGDLRQVRGERLNGTFDVITMNPPYNPLGKGIISEQTADKIARHETDLTLREVCESAARLLKYGGRFAVCLRPERLAETVAVFHETGLEPKRLRMVSQCDGKAPWLFLLEGKKGRAPGLTVEPELHIKTLTREDSPEMLEILGKYRNKQPENESRQ